MTGPLTRYIALLLTIVIMSVMVSCGGEDAPKYSPVKEHADASSIEMVDIPGGTFQRDGIDVPLSPFSMCAYEVKYAQWIKVRDWAEDNGYNFNMRGDMGSEDYGSSRDESHPVTGIEWYDVVLWCNALSEMEGRTPCYYTSSEKSEVYRSGRVDIANEWVDWAADGYRLPLQSEWEYACRAGTTTIFSFGDTVTGSNANYRDSGDSYDNGTTPVGSYPPNEWGLYDMHGNVWEWCWDWYSSTDSQEPEKGPRRELRGGSWYISPEFMYSAFRIGLNPDAAGYDLGFRPVTNR